MEKKDFYKKSQRLDHREGKNDRTTLGMLGGIGNR